MGYSGQLLAHHPVYSCTKGEEVIYKALPCNPDEGVQKIIDAEHLTEEQIKQAEAIRKETERLKVINDEYQAKRAEKLKKQQEEREHSEKIVAEEDALDKELLDKIYKETMNFTEEVQKDKIRAVLKEHKTNPELREEE